MAVRRARPASQVLETMRRGIAKGWPPGLTVLSGDDMYHLDAAQRDLLAALVPPEASDFGLSVYGEAKVSVAEVVNATRSVGMFSPRRVVLVRDVGSLDGEPDALIDFAAHPPAESYLLVRAPSLDQRRKLHKTLATEGQFLLFESAAATAPGRLGAAVQKLATERGLKLDRQAADFLGEACAGDFYRVSSELDKIACWLDPADKQTVTLDVVREVGSGGGLLSGWEIADRVMARERGPALAAARQIVDHGDEPIRILGGLAWRARVMLQGKAMLEAGRSPRQVIQATRSWRYGDDLMRGLSRYRMDELLRFPSALLEADRTLKSRALNPRAVLESLVERLVGRSGSSAEPR